MNEVEASSVMNVPIHLKCIDLGLTKIELLSKLIHKVRVEDRVAALYQWIPSDKVVKVL